MYPAIKLHFFILEKSTLSDVFLIYPENLKTAQWQGLFTSDITEIVYF